VTGRVVTLGVSVIVIIVFSPDVAMAHCHGGLQYMLRGAVSDGGCVGALPAYGSITAASVAAVVSCILTARAFAAGATPFKAFTAASSAQAQPRASTISKALSGGHVGRAEAARHYPPVERRVPLRTDVQHEIFKNAERLRDGDFTCAVSGDRIPCTRWPDGSPKLYDEVTGEPLDKGNPDQRPGITYPKPGTFTFGHRYRYEWRESRLRARRERWTREEVIKDQQDPRKYQLERRYLGHDHEFHRGAPYRGSSYPVPKRRQSQAWDPPAMHQHEIFRNAARFPNGDLKCAATGNRIPCRKWPDGKTPRRYDSTTGKRLPKGAKRGITYPERGTFRFEMVPGQPDPSKCHIVGLP
jgi:hypothetical protein